MRPVMYGGELEVCPNSNVEAPGKTNIAPAVLATAYSSTGALREATAMLDLAFKWGTKIHRALYALQCG